MGLIRLVILFAIIWAVYVLIRRFRQGAGKPDLTHRPRQQVDQVVRCETCGLHIPEKEAIGQDGRWYCCEEHKAGDE